MISEFLAFATTNPITAVLLAGIAGLTFVCTAAVIVGGVRAGALDRKMRQVPKGAPRA